MRLGIDVGSTTVKTVLMDAHDIIYKKYERHLSDVKETVLKQLKNIQEKFGNIEISAVITGSGGMGLASKLGLRFEQEVICSTKAINTYHPETDSIIELGGEDAKVTFLTGGVDQRMNGICAGGTGAFIDQMATLLKTNAGELNEMAKSAKVIYPIASRCGVFAKTDIQPLINDGANKSDIAMSIFNAVVVQTVSVLSCGRKFSGKVALLGGPLFFLSELRKRFKEVLNIKSKDIIFPENAELYVAMGAALLADEDKNKEEISNIIQDIDEIKSIEDKKISDIVPLFKTPEDYEKFKNRHAKNKVPKGDLDSYIGATYLGIDAGSTTTKAVLMSEDGKILYSHYGSNEGSPLTMAMKIVKDVYMNLPKDAYIASTCVTGYGEKLIKKSMRVDFGEIETIAHYKAAKFFNPKVDFILDIGGQDMKCLKIKNNVIDKIILNEACSAGCGSFLESFAKSLGMNIIDFAEIGKNSKNPVDLGSRCTVFMNSRVKQAQKEGATVSDISSGLAYSVIKNALFKVVKLRNVEELGENVVVQGGTFYNDLVLRAFELLSQKEVIRPDIAGLMGAFGCALIARENKKDKTNLLTLEEINNIKVESNVTRCKGCTNKCLLTIHKFSEKDIFVSGNRCEVGEILYTNHRKEKDKKLVNMYKYKYDRVFNYKPLEIKDAKRGEIGIPRVLNMYENYPFWHTFLSSLGFRVVLSSKSSNKIFEKGISSIVSDTACYPAKLVHGHIEDLIEKGIKTIFYPSVTKEYKEDNDLDNNYNCPVVTSYPEVIKNNMDSLENNKIKFINFFLVLNDKEKLKKRCYNALKYFYPDITQKEINIAIDKASEEYFNFKNDIRKKGEETLKELEKNNDLGIILAGRPYHIDPEINHGIPELINSLGISVITEDSISHLAQKDKDLRVVDQWVYHSRLYKAATVCGEHKNLELVQLNSFGCGLDAVTTEQVEEILSKYGKIHTVIKIDEGNNLGAAKIRLRSLIAAVHDREKGNEDKEIKRKIIEYDKHTPLNENHTLLIPQMAPMQFQFLERALKLSNLNVELIRDNSKEIAELGLRYVNNDACYPAILLIGQMIHALKSGKYDLNNTSLLITQTGGGCRATNYIAFLRKALVAAGFPQVPVVSISSNGIEDNGIKKHMTLKTMNKILQGVIYGDLLMKVLLRTRPYEKVKGSAKALYEKWVNRCMVDLATPKLKKFNQNIREIVNDFENLPLKDIKKPRVGLVGEIYVKFNPLANNDLINILEKEGAEVVVPDLMNFFTTCSYDGIYKNKNLDGTIKEKIIGKSLVKIIEFYQSSYRKALSNSKRFDKPYKIDEIADFTKEIVSLGNQTGEGWLLPGEMIELIKTNCNNIICMQPFGCLPNHIIGKGVIKGIKKKYPEANIIPIDYDASATLVNQINRIKLMLSNAR